MKKIILLLLISFSFFAGMSQKFYMTAKIGYGFSVRSDIESIVNVNETYIYDIDNMTNEIFLDTVTDNSYHQNQPISFGRGSKYGGSIGYEISKNFGVEFGVEYTKSKEFEYTYVDNYKHILEPEEIKLKDEYNNRFNAKMLSFHPEVYIKSDHEKFRPYLKLGMVIAQCSNTIYQGLYLSGTGYMSSYISRELANEKNVSLGFSVGTGFDLKLFEGIYFTAEIKYSNITYSPKKGEVTSYTIDGESVVDLLNTNEKYIEYVDEYYATQNDNPSTPYQDLKVQYIFDNLAVFGGLRFDLWSKK